MGQPSILVIDGNRAATREQQVAAGGQPSGEGYAQVLKSLAAVSCDIVPPAFEAITVHRDDIEQLPAGAVVLASNDMGLQAIELRHGAGTFWGVQYHPEYSFAEIAATALRYGAALIEEGLFADRAELEVFVNDLRTLMRDPRDPRLTWKHGLGEGLQQDSCRLVELRNWLELQVLPYARQREGAAARRGFDAP